MRAAVVSVLAVILFPACVHGQGAVIVRIEDPSGSHCIDATSEDVTIHVRRIFLQKTKGIFTEDSRAGVLVSAKLSGRGSSANVDVQVPSITLVTVKDEATGRVSVPLEYQIASYLTLAQDDLLTTDIALYISLAKTRGKTSFGEILDLASKALNKVPIPNNPYSEVPNKFLAFANDAINDTTNRKLDVPFAQVSLAFNKGKEPDLVKCQSAGKERTGAIAVVLSRGLPSAELIPMANTDQRYCFRYSHANTYELLAARRTGGACPSDQSAFTTVNNDYVMFLVSASPSAVGFTPQAERQQYLEESKRRCQAFGLEAAACGVPN